MKSNELIDIRTSELPGCNIVPQPIELLRIVIIVIIIIIIIITADLFLG
jgi:hypothetical protein